MRGDLPDRPSLCLSNSASHLAYLLPTLFPVEEQVRRDSVQGQPALSVHRSTTNPPHPAILTR